MPKKTNKKTTKETEVQKKNTVPNSVVERKVVNNNMYAKILLYISLIGGMIGFLSFGSLPGAFVKTGLVYTGIIATLIIVILSSLKNNKFKLPNNLLSYVFPVLPLVYLISAFYNDATFTSMIGLGAEIGTVSFVFAMSLLVILTGLVFRKKADIVIFQFILVVMAIFLFAIQVLRIISPEFINLSKSLTSPLSSFLGNLQDVGVFYGAILILLLCILELAKLNITRKVIAYAVALLSVFVLSLTGFTYLWIIIGIFALLLFVSVFSFSSRFFPQLESSNKLSYTSLAVVIISAVFIIFGSNISTELQNILKINASGQSYPPSVENTMPVVKSAISQSPVLGVGPNRFDSVWVKEKPLSVNQSVFWNVDYKYGNSFVLTLLVNTGIAGILVWLSILGVLVFSGIKYLFNQKNTVHSYLTFSSFLLSVFLWLALIIYVPSPGMMVLTFMSIGMFISSLYAVGLLSSREYSFKDKPAVSFVVVMAMVLVLIGAVAYEYTVISKVYAANSYNKATSALAINNFTEAKKYMNKAISFGGNDIYYRGLNSVYTKELNVRAPELTTNPTEVQRQASVELFTSARDAAIRAIDANNTNYQNYVSLASLFELLSSPESMNVYENAKKYYDEAKRLNPTDPSLRLSLAGLEMTVGNIDSAKQYINEALSLKSNYVSAYVMLSQIERDQGDVSGSINTLERAMSISPNDIALQLELGKAHYNNDNYQNAKNVFENILRLAPGNGDAKYFLALSLDKLGFENEALNHLMQLKQSNPNNPIIDQALNDIQSNGREVEVETDTSPEE